MSQTTLSPQGVQRSSWKSRKAGPIKPYVELSIDLALTESQVANEGTLHTARTLAMLAAKELAQAEDALFLQGQAGLAGDPFGW